MLAGVSVDYYTRLERGNLKGVSESVLDALARGLRLDGAERAHLFDLARAAGPTTARPRRRSPQKVRPSVQRILDSMTGAPAFAQNGRLDVLAANRLGRALYSEMFANPTRPANLARFVFSNLRSRDFFADWGPTQRGVPHPVGRARRTDPPHRGQERPPPGRGRPRPDVRGADHMTDDLVSVPAATAWALAQLGR